jgi:hypothetical protein
MSKFQKVTNHHNQGNHRRINTLTSIGVPSSIKEDQWEISMFRIMCSKGGKVEELDEAINEQEAIELVDEYRWALGRRWTIWKEVK